MKNDEQDDLWRLLGNAKEPSVSPFFSRNVLRAIREEKQETVSFFARFFGHAPWRWSLLAASLCLLLVITGFSFRHAPQSRPVELAQAAPTQPPQPPPPAQLPQPPNEQVNVLAQQVSTSPDYQVITHLDELLASEETSVWLDK
jgi:hypothetical protein